MLHFVFYYFVLARSSTFESFFPTCPLRIPDDFFKNATFDSCIFMEFNYWWKFFQYLEKVCHWKLASGRHLNCSKGFFCLESGWNSVKSQSLISCSALNLKLFSTSFSDSKTFRFGSVCIFALCGSDDLEIINSKGFKWSNWMRNTRLFIIYGPLEWVKSFKLFESIRVNTSI